jgi:hypothetical protein
MQSGDRLGYDPEKATDELKHFHETLPQAQGAIEAVAKGFAERLNEEAQRISPAHRPSDMDAQKQHRLDALARAQTLVGEAAQETSNAQGRVATGETAK